MTDTPVRNLFILIIEREVGEMESVYRGLLKEDFEYGFARTREDAIRIMDTKLYDFVIMDYAQPGMTVEEFQSILHVNDSKARIIFTYPRTMPSPEIDLKNCTWLGMPFQTEELLDLLR
jgi:DNA-binding response OmpR family regulator